MAAAARRCGLHSARLRASLEGHFARHSGRPMTTSSEPPPFESFVTREEMYRQEVHEVQHKINLLKGELENLKVSARTEMRGANLDAFKQVLTGHSVFLVSLSVMFACFEMIYGTNSQKPTGKGTADQD